MATMHALPQVSLDGRWYYADERLAQIRAVDNPHEWRNFASADEMWDFLNDDEGEEEA